MVSLEVGRLLRDETIAQEKLLDSVEDLLARRLGPLGIECSLVKRESAHDEKSDRRVLPIGTHHYFEVLGLDADGEIDAPLIREVVLDISNRVSTRLASLEMRARLEGVSAEKSRIEKVAQVGTWRWIEQEDTMTWSDSLFDLFGWDRSLGAPPFAEQHRLYYPEDFRHLKENVSHSLTTGEPFEATLKAQPVQGEERLVLARGAPLRDDRQTIVGLSGSIRDVTEHFATRHELQLKSKAVESMFNGFDIVDDEGKFLYVNRAYIEMWGYGSAEEVVGTSPVEHCADPDIPAHIMAELRKHGHGDFEFVGRRKDGSTFDVEMYCRLFQDWRGRELFIGVSTDVTERNDLRKKYLQAQKMEAVGQLTGGVAHDFNNMLHVILGGLQFTLDELEEESPFRRDLENAYNAGRKAATLVKQLLVFSRRQPHKPELLDLNSLIPNVLKMLNRLMGDHVDVRYQASEKVALIDLDQSMLEQLLVNLAINARDALRPKGGQVILRADDLCLQDETLLNAHGASPGSYCRIQVQDNGCGMEPQILEKIFEPFFSTKAEGEGSGLGLSTVYGIAQRHGGFVTAESEPGQGTLISVFFWRCQTEEISKPCEMEGSTPCPTGQDRLILLVDDNEKVRELVSRVLRDKGYQVLVAADGKEGIDIYEQSSSEIALVITDLSMPRMGGVEMLEFLKQRHVGLKAILATGYSDSSVADGTRIRDVPVLHKPFTPGELLRLVEATLLGHRLDVR